MTTRIPPTTPAQRPLMSARFRIRPVASFTYSPTAPITGSPVQFTDTSTGAPRPPGPGTSATAAPAPSRTPAYTFASAGTFTVSLTATNAGGSDTASMDVTVTLGAALDRGLLHPRRSPRRRSRGRVLPDRCRHQQRRRHRRRAIAFQWLPRGANNSDAHPVGDLHHRSRGQHPLRERARRGLRPRARRRRRSRRRLQHRRSQDRQPDLQHVHSQGRRHLRSGACPASRPAISSCRMRPSGSSS